MNPILAKLRVSLPTAARDLPVEFILFKPGANNENFNNEAQGLPQPVFTARSAARMKADFARQARPYALDLEHRSLDKSLGPDATNAMAYFDVEVRPDGSAWAVNLKFTPEGERRLRERSQIWTSPVFTFDRDSGEIIEFIGCGLTSNPATFGIAPLVAATRAPRKKAQFSIVSAAVPVELKIALGVFAAKRGATLSAALRRIIESADVAMLARSTAKDLVRLCDLLGIKPNSTPDEVRDALEDFLAELPADAPAAAPPDVPVDPAAGAADAPKPDPSKMALRRDSEYSPAVQTVLLRMGPVERAKFDAAQAKATRDRARATRARPARPPLSPATAAKVAKMTPEQRATFRRMRNAHYGR